MVSMATRILYGIEFFERDHPRIIPVKFGDNLPSTRGDQKVRRITLLSPIAMKIHRYKQPFIAS